jgi:acyl carrier protein
LTDYLTLEEFVDLLKARVPVLSQITYTDTDVQLSSYDLDSLALYEVLLCIEELGADVPDELFEVFDTVRDLYEHYLKRVTEL